MSLVDRTNEEIPLVMELPHGCVLKVDVDADSHVWPEPWVWLEVDHADDPDLESHAWRLTFDEAANLHDRLGRILGKVPKQRKSFGAADRPRMDDPM